jgi:hypothetical protein
VARLRSEATELRRQLQEALAQVRETPSWPRSWANVGPLYQNLQYPHRNARTNLRRLAGLVTPVLRAQPVIDCETGMVEYLDRGPIAKRQRLATPPMQGAMPVGRLLAVKQELVAKDAVVVRERAGAPGQPRGGARGAPSSRIGPPETFPGAQENF